MNKVVDDWRGKRRRKKTASLKRIKTLSDGKKRTIVDLLYVPEKKSDS